MKILLNGNIELTVQLLPEAYAALTTTAERDKCSLVDVVNVALVSHNMISKAAKAAGHGLGDVEAERGECPEGPVA